ncbi:THAP domain-containing protein 1-like isoform X13 [Ceratina calcarata]|uniref:THAP domain-containing protein 1-like isoform X13 n=1 Tax=Ceratina calcarata TaxID=156304 RepID=A0AAJ7S4E9_9HYME|nr:THAP domain-containing protein 1-like isoform X13 [Ceratina calcarata]
MHYRDIVCTIYSLLCNARKPNPQRPPITFHRFPCDEKRKKQWADVIGIDEKEVLEQTRICSVHFTEDMFDRRMLYTLLRKHAVPQLLLNGKKVPMCPSKSIVVIEDSSEDMEINVEQ